MISGAAVDDSKSGVSLIAVSMENSEEEYDKLIKKFNFSFIEHQRKDLRDELVNRFNITRVPYILAFNIY